MKQVTKNFREYHRELILGPLFKLFEAVLELMVPLVMANIIDIGIAGGDRRYILTRGLLLLLLGALGVAAAMLCQYYAARVAGGFGRSLRGQTYRHVLRLSGSEVSAFGTGGLITRLTGDVSQVQTGINMAIRLGTRVPFLAIGSIVMALRISPRIGLLFLLSTPLIVLVLYLIMRRTLPSYAKVQAGQDDLSRLSTEDLAGARIVRAFSRQEDEAKAYEQAAQDLTRVTVRVGKISAALNPLTSVIANLTIIAIVWLGARFAFQGSLLQGEVIALVNYMNQTLLALIVAANLIVVFTRALASARRLETVLETEPAITAPAHILPFSPDPETPAVAFEGVTFSYYEGASPALEGIDFRLARGHTIGLIGGTGSGKSTLVALLMRYFDPQQGTISLEGTELRDLDPADLRHAIGLAPQQAVLFSGTVRHNLRMGTPDAPEKALWEALEVAQAADFVRQMPEGLDSFIEEGGKNLSGGQRQRLTIARAVLRKPRLLILDDSTSALDYATDAALRRALAREKSARPEMTLLMISQRAASLRGCDHILVLDDGKLAGQGTHEELLRDNPVYQEICLSQGIEGVAL